MKSTYKFCALTFFNTVLLYALLNIVLGAAIGIRNLLFDGSGSGHSMVTQKYGLDVLDKAYPEMNRQERDLMLSELSKSQLTFSDYNHFRNRPIRGKYLNVSAVGYRESANQGPWPPAPENLNVFAFGGSTTFGVGVPDYQTVPSFLQQALASHSKKRVCVYNFGVGFYYSTQERICFEKLLMDGFVPDVATFMDGINEGTHLENRPTGSEEMSVLFERFSGSSLLPAAEVTYWGSLAEVLFYRLPIGKVARHLMATAPPDKDATQNWEGEKSAIRVCETYFTNKFLVEQLCQRFGVTPVFIWQPSPAYNYDSKYNLFAPSPSLPAAMRYHYKIMPKYYEYLRDHLEQHADVDFLWCADMQKDRHECLYCDRYHYNAAFSKDVAEYICQLCVERKLIDQLSKP